MPTSISCRELLAVSLFASLLRQNAAARLPANFQRNDEPRVIGALVQTHPPSEDGRSALNDKDPPISVRPEELTLCDCEQAMGAPHGLSCEKEGWFVTGFERKGSWLIGGGLVPLSAAVCCRPCLPDALPEDPSGSIAANETALALVSLGCHASTVSGPGGLACESQGGSLVVGWAQAMPVGGMPAIQAAFYPVGAAECCTPALLLQSGDAWELERCDCVTTDDISCGGQSTGRILQGFSHWRATFDSQYVPIAPATCCKACVSQTVHPINECLDRNMCSGHGACILGQCECFGGWHGGDCGELPNGDIGGDLPAWAVALIVMASCVTLGIVLVVLSKVAQYFNLVETSEEVGFDLSDSEEPLIVRLGEDDRGSVGSEDTTDCNSDTEAAIASVEADLGAAGEDGSEGFLPDEESQSTVDGTVPARYTLGGIIPRQERHHLLLESLAAALAEHRAQEGAETPSEPAATSNAPIVSEMAEAQPAIMAAAAARGLVIVGAADSGTSGPESLEDAPCPHRAAPDGEAGGGITEATPLPGEGDDAVSPPGDSNGALAADSGKAASRQRASKTGAVPDVECSVCMVCPVQVVLVPCGHACMCRRCSRRLSRCPVCRNNIFRRQRIFMGGQSC